MQKLACALVVLIVLPLTLAACGGSDVKGYDDLVLTPQEEARKDVFDAAAAYAPVQIVLATAVKNPDLPPGIKDSIKDVDLVAVTALAQYRAAVEAGADDVTAKLAAAMAALTRAQNLMLELYEDGRV